MPSTQVLRCVTEVLVSSVQHPKIVGYNGDMLRINWEIKGTWSTIIYNISPPARWGLLDFMSVACSSSPLLSSSSPLLLLLVALLVLLVQLRPAIHSVLCRTSTTTIHAQCSLPDLNRECPCQVFPAGPQPRPSTPSVPCRTSTTTIPAQCSLPDLNHDHPRPVFPAGPQPRVSTPSVPCRTSCRKIWDKECAEES